MSSPNRPSGRRTRSSSRASSVEPATPSRKTPRKTPMKRKGSQDGSSRGSNRASADRDIVPPSVGATASEMEMAPTSPINPRSVPVLTELNLSSPLNYGTPSTVPGTPASNIRATPVRHRVDIRSEKRVRQVNIGGSGDLDLSQASVTEPRVDATSDSGAGGVQLVIWGTDVVINQVKSKFKKFISTFKIPEQLDEEDAILLEADERIEGLQSDQPIYMQKLEEIYTLEEPFLNINCAHLKYFDVDLYRQLICYPQEVIPAFDMSVNELFFERYPEAQLAHQIQTRPFNADKTKNIRGLNPEDIDQLITIGGLVIRTSNIIPEMREGFFRCNVCRATTTCELDRGRITEPTNCPSCHTVYSYSLIHNRCQFSDKQLVKLQESPDDMPAGQTPHTVALYAHNDLVDTVQPGDRISVTGIFRATPMQDNPRQRNVKSVYRTHLDVVHFRKVNNKRLYEDNDDGKECRFTQETIERLQNFSKIPDIYERLAASIAPSIYENEDIKKGILLQLFGGTKKSFTGVGRGAFRAEINILLCGDPGTSKSQLLQYVHNLVPRGQYTSGKGSSAVGLTAYVTKDPETKQLVLQTGALVLSDNGICCIDEFDKMNDSTRSILHEVMEQQTLSIAKAGIICQLNARTSVLAAANPVESQWDKNKTIIENIQLPHTLLSRFDLIFLMLDPQDDLYDRRLARHLVSIYYQTEEEDEDQFLDMKLLKDYIAYAKAYINPHLTEESSQALIQAYVDMRKIGSGKGQVTAYPRQLESFIRLAEAHAKVRFSNTVEMVDVEEAKRLHREALKQSATDPVSGKIDISILTTGLSTSARQRRMDLAKALAEMLRKKGKNQMCNYQKVFTEFREQSDVMVSRETFEDVLKELQDQEVIVITGRTSIRVC